MPLLYHPFHGYGVFVVPLGSFDSGFASDLKRYTINPFIILFWEILTR